ncbi:MAG: cell division protein ZapE [Parvibaculaceae bacterium]
MGFWADYQEKIRSGAIKPDEAQAAVARKLDALTSALADYDPRPQGFLGRLIGRKNGPAPKGLYIQGDVGRGKTMLMDMFCAEVQVAAKRRVHFHAFMQDIHARLHQARRHSKDPLKEVAQAVAAEAVLLCLDEMQIADIADAMIVGRLFEILFARGTVVVTTSNLEPADLYTDGLNRQLFLPFIRLIEERLELVTLASPTDYRLGRVKGHETFIHPLGPPADRKLQELWERLTDTEKGETRTLDVLGRQLAIPQAAHGAARFSFAELCEAPLGPPDYLAIAKTFGTVFIEHIPVLTQRYRNPSKRFILLIDTLYDARIRLVASAAAPPEALHNEGHHVQEFARTVSRLKEMQAASWWGAKIAET